ncbi:hypothetical protein M408DRAFT_326402 [Serendipita vermifera MAFF 305830]|uniref:UNC-45/Cro1/She4 central domain-containing protein n=1 Tax=Serendipita vermifera MAFF 305830 TaxID=933852 RepID=A0A0C2XUT0_SERVB|nr:hypothetical protein M408DRAFT_326402 [Serendipita vermifera MAFF 305830]
MSKAPSTSAVAAPKDTATNQSDEDLTRLVNREPHLLDKRHLRKLFEAFYEDHDENIASNSQGNAPVNERAEQRAAAYVTLSSIIQSLRTKSATPADQDEGAVEKGTKEITALFAGVILDGLQQSLPTEQAGALGLLSALFDVDSPSAARLVQNEEILDALMTLLNGELENLVAAQMARLLERAMAHPLSRSLLREGSDFTAVRWLIRTADGGKSKKGDSNQGDTQARISAILAIVKLIQGSEQDEQASKYIPSSSAPTLPSIKHLAILLQNTIIKTDITNVSVVNSSFLDAVEGLAYLTSYPPIRTQVASSTPLLVALFKSSAAITKRAKPSSSLSSDRLLQPDAALRLAQTNLAMHYGLALLFYNLCKYKPVLSQEEQQINKLRTLAKPPSDSSSSKGGTSQEDDEDASNAAVLSRTRALVAAGLLPALAGLARSPSAAARACVSGAYLGVIQDNASRGEVLKHGGGKALLGIIGEHAKSKEPIPPNWTAIQALAKLAITASPLAVFGADPGATYDAIGPLALVITFSSEGNFNQSTKKSPLTLGSSADGGPTQLQRFESLMALTNIASLGPEMAKRVVKTNGLVREVESLLVEEHVLLRRAAVELVCNLIPCEEGFSLFLPESSTGASRAQSRIHVLVALSDVDDIATRKAASGALAILSSEEAICLVLARLQRERGSVLRILGRLLLEEAEDGTNDGEQIENLSSRLAELSIADPDLVHRGMVILRNLAVLFIQPQKEGWREFVADMVREGTLESVDAVVKDSLQRGGNNARGPIVEGALEFGLALKRVSGS